MSNDDPPKATQVLTQTAETEPTWNDSSLRILDEHKLKWRLPDDPVADEVLIPGLRCAERFDCMVGFFSGQALRQLAPGLASFISRNDLPMRLLVSPLMPEDDLAAIRTGLSVSAEWLATALGVALNDEVALTDALATHTLECLAYLLSAGRLDIKIVIIDEGTFHVKEWILRARSDIVVLSGSANFTARALTRNVESLHLHRSWRDKDNFDTCTESVAEFELLWNDTKPGVRAYDLPSAVADDLIATYARDSPPTEAEYLKAVTESAVVTHSREADTPSFIIPRGLQLHSGPYAHQGKAIAAWEDNQRRGILAMATGTGKTVCALAAAKRLQEECTKLLVLVSVPTRPLLTQWADECTGFGLTPIVARNFIKTRRLRRVQHSITNLELGVTETEAIVVTNDGLADPDFLSILSSYDGDSVFISDEVHNLGGMQSFIANPPEWMTYRLGLSATPVRQYDEPGTHQLLSYFGEVVFEFSLSDAIGVCLVPYDYHIHLVQLGNSECEDYVDLSRSISKRIARNGGEFDSDDATLMQLCSQRRLLLETAAAKLESLELLLDSRGSSPICRTLFYATDKDPQQLRDVNEILISRRIRAHQITESETRNGRLMTAAMTAFEAGTLQALTAKRVLDEGINVPQIDTAYILASTTIRKQWIQRRGRVLRPSPKTGKTHATIHDFVVLPPAEAPKDQDSRRLIEGELARCDEFASIARNRASSDGPYDAINQIRYEYLV